MYFGTIASGSSGNSLYVGTEHTHLLVDAGISCKRLLMGLDQFGIGADQIQGILITHEHSDHISGLGVLSRKYHIPVFATYETIEEIHRTRALGDLSSSDFYIIEPDRPFELGDIDILPFAIPHDAVNPVSYTFESRSSKAGMVTDLGCYDEHIIESLKGCDFLYVEANHDVRMLQTGPYPYPLKQRILGARGHLCNEEAGRLIVQLQNDHLKHVVLGHLSKENNYPELALAAVRLEVFQTVEAPANGLDIQVAPRDHSAGLWDF